MDMLAFCQDYYRDNLTQLNLIEELRHSYQPHMAVKWYTIDSFLFRLLNKTLRTEDTDALYLFRAFIVDLCSQLEEVQRHQPISDLSLIVYHAQCMYMTGLNKLKANIGHLISTNAFFSTSLSEHIAVIYSEHDSQSDSRESVIMKINVNTRLRHTIFARINNERFNYVPDEDEVLFSLSTVFKIIDVCKENDKDRWIVQLEATDKGREIFNEYKQLSKLDTVSIYMEIDFRRLLMDMRQHSKAIKYFTSLAARLDVNDTVGHATIIDFHSTCLYILGKYDEAQSFLENGLEILDRMQMSSMNIHFLRCRFPLGNVHVFKENLKLARNIFEEILHDQERTLLPSHIHIADTIQGIGLIYSKETGYDQSLKYTERALRIYEQTLPSNHPKRIRT